MQKTDRRLGCLGVVFLTAGVVTGGEADAESKLAARSKVVTESTAGAEPSVWAESNLAAEPDVSRQQQVAAEPKPGAPGLPAYLKDRGTGVATSMFGTYIRRGELIVYPYWEYYLDNDRQYSPSEFDFAGPQDYRGRYRESEWLFFAAYGVTENFAVQAEIAGAKASLEKAAADLSAMPRRYEASGLTSFETQLRWRMRKETERRPELWSYLDVVYPTNRKNLLIGTAGVEAELGFGVTRGFRFGTLTARVSGAYEGASDTHFALGEYGVEYLKRLSPRWRVFAGINGHETALTFITEAQWHLHKNVFIRLNQEIGLTRDATGWEPQLGILFTLPTRRTR
jgi:hypothetical protein